MMVDLAVLGAVLLVALGVGRRMLNAVPFPYLLEEGLFATAFGLGLLAYATLACGIAGVLNAPALIALLAFGAWYARREIRSSVALAVRGLMRWRGSQPTWTELAAIAIGVALLAAELVMVSAPPVGGDQTKYQLVYPRLFAEAGRLVATPWSFWGYMQYLGNMLYTAAFALRGDVLARLFNVAFGVLCTLAVFATGRRWFGRGVGVWAALLFATMPLTTTLMVRAWVEFALTLYVLLAVVAVMSWRETGSRAWLALGAVMAGFAGGTKLMGVLAAALLGVLIVVEILRRQGRAAIVPALRAAIGFGLLAAVVASPCYLRNAVATGNPIFPFGYGVFGGQSWNADAARALDGYYAAYRDTQARKRGAAAYASTWETLRFPWDATMAPQSFEETARFAYDVGPFVLAFAPGALLLMRNPRVAVLVTFALGYGAIIVFGMWAHPRYVHPTLPLLLVAGVTLLHALRAGGAWASRAVTATLAVTVLVQTGLSLRVLQPLFPASALVAAGRMSAEEYLRRFERPYPLWSTVNATVPADETVLVLGMIPHPYHLHVRFVLASPLEQAAIDYRRITTVDELLAALAPFHPTWVAWERMPEKPGTNPLGTRVTDLWEGLVERAEKVAETSAGALYRLNPTNGSTLGSNTAMRPAPRC